MPLFTHFKLLLLPGLIEFQLLFELQFHCLPKGLNLIFIGQIELFELLMVKMMFFLLLLAPFCIFSYRLLLTFLVDNPQTLVFPKISYLSQNYFWVLGDLLYQVFLKRRNFLLIFNSIADFVKHVNWMVYVTFAFFQIDVINLTVPINIRSPLRIQLFNQRLLSQPIVVYSQFLSFFDDFLFGGLLIPVDLLRQKFAFIQFHLFADRVAHGPQQLLFKSQWANRLLQISMSKLLVNNFRYLCHWQKNCQRKPFSQLESKDVEHFNRILPNHSVITDPQMIQHHNEQFTKMLKGNSKLLLCPQNTQQVSQILRYCNERRLAVVPQGGNTGLVGGSVPVFDEIIVSLKNMNKIEKFDPVSSVVNVEAGVVLERLSQFLEPEGCETPLDLGAKGSCMVGGNASTNAGGKYVIKFGSFRSHILGIEAVLPSGEVLDMRSQIMKDNTGYDLKQLFIGGEGTLGIITRLNIHCPKIDPLRKIIVFKTDNFENIVKSIPRIKSFLGRNLNALECLDQVAYRIVTTKLHPALFSKVLPNQYLLFIEASTEKLDGLFDILSDFNDGIMSSNDNQFNRIWKIREDVSIAAKMCGKVLAYDLSYEVRQWPNLVAELRKSIKAEIMGYGHIGDGNIHINMIMKEGQQARDREVYETVAKKNGSISAEHGVGQHKSKYLHLQKSPEILRLHRMIKNLMDPNGIMNPYKLIPEQ